MRRSTRLRAGLAAGAVCSLLTALPSGAATPPQATDPCGDAGSGVEARQGGRTVGQEVEGSRASLDLAAAQVRLSADGSALEAVLTLCGDASSEVLHLVQWGHGDGAYSTLSFIPASVRERTTAPEVRFTERRYAEAEGPLDTGDPGVVSATVLPASAFAVQGRTATLTLPLAQVPPASRPRFQDGTRWSDVSALVQDPDTSYAQWGRGTDPLPSHDATVRLDTAYGGDWTVGPEEG